MYIIQKVISVSNIQDYLKSLNVRYFIFSFLFNCNNIMILGIRPLIGQKSYSHWFKLWLHFENPSKNIKHIPLPFLKDFLK